MRLFFSGVFRIPKDIVIKGNVYTVYSCTVRGKIEGSLHSEGSVLIGKGGILEGNIFAKKIRVQGLVFGDVHADKLSVLPGGQVRGKILAGHVHIYETAIVEDIEAIQPIISAEAPKTNNHTWF